MEASLAAIAKDLGQNAGKTPVGGPSAEAVAAASQFLRIEIYPNNGAFGGGGGGAGRSGGRGRAIEAEPLCHQR